MSEHLFEKSFANRALAMAMGVLCLVLSGGVLTGDAWAVDKKLVIAHTGTPGNSVFVFFEEFAENLREMSGGRIVAEVHPAGELGGDRQLVQQLQTGQIDVASAATAGMGGFTTAFLWTDLPYVFQSRADAHKVFNDSSVGPVLAKQVASEVGTKVLGYIDVGGFRMLQNTKRQLRTPADVNGLKIRVTASPIDQALIGAWGALPTPVAWAETFTAVQQGVVDGLNLQPVWTQLNGFGQVIKHATRNNAVMAFHVVQMSMGTWDALPEDLKSVVARAAREAFPVANKFDLDNESKFVADLKKDGVDIYEPSAEEMKAWHEAALPVWKDFEDKVDSSLLEKVKKSQM